MKQIVLLLFSFLLLLSCGSDDMSDEDFEAFYNLTYDDVKDWVVTEVIDNSTNEDISEDCDTDNIYTFWYDGEFEFDNQGTACDEEADYMIGTWDLLEDNTRLSLYDFELYDVELDYDIVRLTRNELIISNDSETISLTPLD